jgi:hypothetical protein
VTLLPAGMELWTSDEVAECLPYQRHLPPREASELYSLLWAFLSEAQNPTPLGGDGTGGTVEYPDARRRSGNDDKAAHWWPRLTEPQRLALVKAWEDS